MNDNTLTMEEFTCNELLNEKLKLRQSACLRQIDKKIEVIREARKNSNPYLVQISSEEEMIKEHSTLIKLRNRIIDIEQFKLLSTSELDRFNINYKNTTEEVVVKIADIARGGIISKSITKLIKDGEISNNY